MTINSSYEPVLQQPHNDNSSSSSSSSPPPPAPPSYASHILNDIGSLAPIRYIGSLIEEANREGDSDGGDGNGNGNNNILDTIEQVEHFKYKQDLERKLTVTSVIGLGFSLMGVPFGLSSTLWISLMDGANVTILYGWLIVGGFSLCVILSLSEIISKYPTAGGVYHFSSVLSDEKYSNILSWFTGWFLLIGNWT